MKKLSNRKCSDPLLVDLEECSGLSLEELQFLGKAGLLCTHLRRIPTERYTLEEWQAGLAVLYDRRIRLSSPEELRQWLDRPFETMSGKKDPNMHQKKELENPEKTNELYENALESVSGGMGPAVSAMDETIDQ